MSRSSCSDDVVRRDCVFVVIVGSPLLPERYTVILHCKTFAFTVHNTTPGRKFMGKKKVPHRSVTFRMPVEHYETLAEVAEARGIDVSALLNQVVADALPGLLAWLVRHREQQGGGSSISLAEALTALHALSP